MASDRGPVLDEALFPNLAPLLAACQSYASLSGCRFRGSSFDHLPAGRGRFCRQDAADGGDSSSSDAEAWEEPGQDSADDEERERERVESEEPEYVWVPRHIWSQPRAAWPPRPERGPLLQSARQAAAQVRSFARRARRREPGLVEELLVAHDMVMEEAVRRSMVCSFQRLDMWPPLPAPLCVALDDCSYGDVDAPMPVIAQRAFNYDLKRRSDPTNPYRRAMTAAFLVDFASEAGVSLPGMSADQQRRFEDFQLRAAAEELHELVPLPEQWPPSSRPTKQARRYSGTGKGGRVEQPVADDRSVAGVLAHSAAMGPMAAIGPMASFGFALAVRA